VNRLCGHEGTRSGESCRNWVAAASDHCSAGHPCRVVPVSPGTTFATFADPGAPFDLDGLVAVGAARSALEARAHSLEVDLGPTLDESATDEDVAWSTNDWCLSKVGVIHAGDVLLERPSPGGPEVLLIRRAHPPFASIWALPGGMRDEGEALTQTARRELAEEVGIDLSTMATSDAAVRDLGEDQTAEWDTRFVGAHVGALYAVVPYNTRARAQDDARAAQWVPLAEVASGAYPLAFGHAEWFKRAYRGDPALGVRFRLLRDAGRQRNRRLIAHINEVRQEAGVPTIEVRAPMRLAS
jgi:ADP-ribose pyrophosphatase YjhB (NUDIX family)